MGRHGGFQGVGVRRAREERGGEERGRGGEGRGLEGAEGGPKARRIPASPQPIARQRRAGDRLDSQRSVSCWPL